MCVPGLALVAFVVFLQQCFFLGGILDPENISADNENNYFSG